MKDNAKIIVPNGFMKIMDESYQMDLDEDDYWRGTKKLAEPDGIVIS